MGNKFIDKIVKKFNSEDVIKFSEKDGFNEVKSWAHTGSPTLDYNLRTFGLPTGIIEIAGKSRSGKTTLGLMSMKHFLKENPENGIAVILSSENRDNKDYALQLGLPVNDIIIVKIKYVEAMFMQVKKLITDANEILSEMFNNNLRELGITDIKEAKATGGSSDIGNVSHVAPTIHPYIGITDCPMVGHSIEMANATTTSKAHDRLLIAALAMAYTGHDVIVRNESLRK